MEKSATLEPKRPANILKSHQYHGLCTQHTPKVQENLGPRKKWMSNPNMHCQSRSKCRSPYKTQGEKSAFKACEANVAKQKLRAR